jgi:quercetin dioxygenase-like cupin family protein
MNVFTSDTAMLSDEYGIQIGRWQQYRQQGLPFDAMWCVIPPGGSSAEDFHPERELQIVVSGSGAVETPATGACRVVEVGTAMLLDPHERHILRNRSADFPFVVLSVYWLPEQLAGADSLATPVDIHTPKELGCAADELEELSHAR